MLFIKNSFFAFCAIVTLLIAPSHAVIIIAGEAHSRHTSEISIARNLADNIANIVRNGRTTMELALDSIMQDHSQDSHKANDSYFRTSDRDEIRSLLNLVINNPDSYVIQKVGQKDRMLLRKTISENDAMRIMGHKNVGYDNSDAQYVNHVVLVFDITGINNLSDSLVKGAFLTAFPTRENF